VTIVPAEIRTGHHPNIEDYSVIPFYTTVALADGGWNYGPKHVIVNAINKLIYVDSP
jgi:hypothetical protein